MNLKRIMLRSWFYFRQGYSTYLALPVGLFASAVSVYYLAVANYSIKTVLGPFANFSGFLVVSLLFIGFLGVFFGWIHYKKLLRPFYLAEQDISVEANPYAMDTISPVYLPLFKIVSELGTKNNIDTSEIDVIIKTTEQKFGKKSIPQTIP